MDATQMIDDSILDSEEEDSEEENENKRGQPQAKLRILRNEHIPEAELPLFLGDNVLGRDPNTCTLALSSPSVSKQHVSISISVYRSRGCHSEVDMEALVWDMGSMNGTRKGRLKLTPNVRYALSDGDSLVVADIPCQFVTCAVEKAAHQEGSRTPVSSISGEKPELCDNLNENRSHRSPDGENCVNGGTEASSVVSLPDQEDSKKTPARSKFLSFEQTPTQPQGTLVPESDSESDDERVGGRDRRRKTLVSDSDSHISSPTCSSFLSPTNKIIPESEDECPITPLSSTKNRPNKHVSFSKEETDADLHRQQLKKKETQVTVDGREERRMEDRAAPDEREPEESRQLVAVKEKRNVSLAGDDELPASKPAGSTEAAPAFNMDSDTDMEGDEEELPSESPVSLNTKKQADQPTKLVQLHVDSDSDTDVDEVDDASDKSQTKSVPSSDDTTSPRTVAFVQPTGITLDSDTDVDDDADAAVSNAATKATPTSPQSANTADSAPSTQPKEFHLDSDTDVDEEEENEGVTKSTSSVIDETPSRLDLNPTGADATAAAPHSLHLDSDTDDETVLVPASSKPPLVITNTESPTTETRVDLEILSNSDTDVEADAPPLPPVSVAAIDTATSSDKNLSASSSVTPISTLTALHSDSDADTDVDESSAPPTGDIVESVKVRLDSDTDVEDEEANPGEPNEGQIPDLHREKTPGLPIPQLHKCSTPVALSGEVEEMETQAFLSPSSGPFRCTLTPPMRPGTLASSSDSQEDEDFVVAETQSFVLAGQDCQSSLPDDRTMDATQAYALESSSGDEREGQTSGGGSLQLGLSDSSHLPCQAQTLVMESTQAFTSVGGDVNLEDTQAYGAFSAGDRTSVQKESDLEATQAYGASVKEGHVDFALEATQAYIPESHSDPQDETEEGTHLLDHPTTSTKAVAETQPMAAFEEEEINDKPLSSAPVKPKKGNQTGEGKEQGSATPAQERAVSEAPPIAETQPMAVCEDEESDDEDSIPGPRTRKAKPLIIEETQSLTSSELSVVETQPTQDTDDQTQPKTTQENKESDDDEDSVSGPWKRKARLLQLEEETQSLTSSEPSAAETQPMVICEDDKSDDERSVLGPRKRKAKPLQFEDEATQPLTISETQPMQNDEDNIEKGAPTSTRISKTEILPIPRGEEDECDENETKAGTSGIDVISKRRTRVSKEEQQEECSEPPKRQTRGKDKALVATRRRRGKVQPQEDEKESEEEETEPAKQCRGTKSKRQQKHDKEDKRLLNEQAREKVEEQEEKAAKELKQQEEREKMEKERRDIEERERTEMEERERLEQEKREEQEKIEQEQKEREERLQCENAERAEKERVEKERKEREEKEKAERMQKEKEEQEQRERERKEQERLERVEREKEEQERLERERMEQECRARLEKEVKEREEREKQEKEAQDKLMEEDENKPIASTRGQRAARRTVAALPAAELEQDTSNNDFPARRTGSRSNSSNSVGSERSASSINTQESRGRGRGRGAKRTSQPDQSNITRVSNRRRTVAGEPSAQGTTIEQDVNEISAPAVLSRSNSTNSLNSEISSCSGGSQNRGRGDRQRGRGRKTESKTDSILPISSQSDQSPASKATTRGRRSRKAEEASNEDNEGKADALQFCTTRGRRRADVNDSEPTAADAEDQSTQEEEHTTGGSLLPKRNVRGRSQKAQSPATTVAADGDEGKDKRKGRKRELEEDAKEDEGSSSKTSRGKVKAQTAGSVEEEVRDEAKEENSALIPVKRRGTACSTVGRKSTQESLTEAKEETQKVEEEVVERKARGRPSVAQRKTQERQEESGTSALNSMDKDANIEVKEQPQTPTSSGSRKRRAPEESSPLAKTPRSSSASPAARGRVRAASQPYKVLFTGVTDDAGEKVVARLGGAMAKGVTDMTCLVTDKVRRTVKFLCGVAKGVPIVTTHWLDKSGKAGSFLPPNSFLVKDPEQEKKFNFCLQESLRVASSQPLLQGYEIHVTKSVKPEPVHMKEIITCSGATFLPRMPSAHKPQTVVISCEEDWPLCGPAVSASVPICTAEFILTGILQQKVDFQTHILTAPATNQPSAAGRGRGRKKP